MKRQSATRGFTILGAAGMINKLLGLAYIPFLTLMIGDVGNGIYNAGYAVYQMIFVITNLGVPVAISKLVSEKIALSHHRDALHTLWASLGMMSIVGCLSMLATMLFSKTLASWVGIPEASLTLFALAPTMLFTAIASTFRGYFQGRANMTPTALSQVLEQAINAALTLLFAWLMLRYGQNIVLTRGITDPALAQLTQLSYAAAGGTVGTTAGALCSAAFLAIYYNRHRAELWREARMNNPQMSITGTLCRTIWAYAIPIVIGSAAVYMADLVDTRFVMQRLLDAGFARVDAVSLRGVLTTQYQKIQNIPLVLAAALSATVLPNISAAFARKSKKDLSSCITHSYRTVLLFSLPAAVGLAALAGPIINTLFSQNPRGVDLLRIGAVTVALISMVQIQTAMLQGMGKTYIPPITIALGLVLKIGVNYWLVGIASVNIRGAVVGSIACYLWALIVNQFFISKISKCKVDWMRVVIPPLLASALMGLVVGAMGWFLPDILSPLLGKWANPAVLILGLVVGVAVYGFSMWKTGGIQPTDLPGSVKKLLHI